MYNEFPRLKKRAYMGRREDGIFRWTDTILGVAVGLLLTNEQAATVLEPRARCSAQETADDICMMKNAFCSARTISIEILRS